MWKFFSNLLSTSTEEPQTNERASEKNSPEETLYTNSQIPLLFSELSLTEERKGLGIQNVIIPVDEKKITIDENKDTTCKSWCTIL